MDLVSVIIPYYKKKKFIVKSVESVINQTYKNIEIIIIYDNESNIELDYIKNLENKDFRIKLIINKKNIGAGESRNKGIKFSKGKYIAFLDADDIWVKNKIEKQLFFYAKG
jgi:teichuronic acid biosynthesis glycosyltransferase TuaG